MKSFQKSTRWGTHAIVAEMIIDKYNKTGRKKSYRHGALIRCRVGLGMRIEDVRRIWKINGIKLIRPFRIVL
jgi:hypothetical protein